MIPEDGESWQSLSGKGWPVRLLESNHNPQWSEVIPLAILLAEVALEQ
ncbi:MAG: hypothetical protein GWM87_07210 [Xanthomonadales bacterium]|nr:hypothetical protein [Xanthomonadales bacterium]NIX12743.1 hypothetical protein [Xanthomonadales bacterium]